MNSHQRKYLRGLAHKLKPAVFIGKSGITPEVLQTTEAALDAHELIKIKFIDHKENKKGLTATICRETSAEQAGIIGHMAILYRAARKPLKQKIVLPAPTR